VRRGNSGGFGDLTSELLEILGYEVTLLPVRRASTENVRACDAVRRKFLGGHFGCDGAQRHGRHGDNRAPAQSRPERHRNHFPAVHSDEAAVAEFLSYGFRATLPKPFTRHELASVLQRAFETSKTDWFFVSSGSTTKSKRA